MDSTLSFTALDGLCLGTRPGVLDPGVVLYLFQTLGLSAKDVESVLYKKSGLLGISGISNDMRDLLGNPAPSAQLAVDYFVYQVAKQVGAMAGALGGVDGLVAVNDRAGGHAGARSAAQLLDELAPLGKPIVAAGGVGDAAGFVTMLALGYDGVQMGTRFIATTECAAHASYKAALVDARAEDIVLTERVTGVPLAVINTPYVQRIGTRAGPLARRLLLGRRTKHMMRAWYTLRSAVRLKRASLHGNSSKDYWQAGKSVEGISEIEPAGAIVHRFAVAAGRAGAAHR
jgi:nitronate monooxygenase